jgi:DNA primase catalytic subunit
MNSSLRLELSIADQLLRVVRSRRVIRTFPVSTAERGVGFASGSWQTPVGRFEIADKIGGGMPIHTVFTGRKPIGVWSPDHIDNRDLILTRILRLRGLDPENTNTWKRYIYIHGTNHEASLGTPTSHGCVRMSNRDIIELFDMIPAKTPLLIQPPDSHSHPRQTTRRRKIQKNLTLSVTTDKFSAYFSPAMSTKNKNTNKGKRYSPAEKQQILAYVEQINKAKGRGGQKAASGKYGVSQLTISAWKKAAGKPAVKKAVVKKAVKKAVVKKVAKKAVAKKAAQKAVKKAVVKKAVKKAVVKKAVKKAIVKKAASKMNKDKGKRYSAGEKQAILNFVDAVNKQKGRGGQTAAAKKYGVAMLTIAGWIKKSGKKPVVKKAVKKAIVKKAVKKAVVKKAVKKAIVKKVKKGKKAASAADIKKAIARAEAVIASLKAMIK